MKNLFRIIAFMVFAVVASAQNITYKQLIPLSNLCYTIGLEGTNFTLATSNFLFAIETSRNAAVSNGVMNFTATNVISLSTSNAISKPLTNSYVSGVLSLFGIEAGVNINLTQNGSNIVISTSGAVGEANVNGEVSITNALIMGVVYDKVNITNRLRSFSAGANVILTNEGTNIVIASTASGGGGETNYNGEVSITNATMLGWVYDKLNFTNRLRSIAGRNGLVATNEGTNISLAIDAAIVASQANLTSASNVLDARIIAATNSPLVTNWVNFRQPADTVLSNLVGTVANNVTNVISLSISNATSQPLTNLYTGGTLTLFGIEQGANVTLTPNGSNIVIAASSSGGSTQMVVAAIGTLDNTNSVLFRGTGRTTNEATPMFFAWNTNGQILIATTNQPGFSNFLAGYSLTLSNAFEAPTNTVQSQFIRFVTDAFQTGTGATNSKQFSEFGYIPTINAVGTTNGGWFWITRPTANGVPTTNMVLSSGGALSLNGSGNVISIGGGAATINNSGTISGAPIVSSGRLIVGRTTDNSTLGQLLLTNISTTLPAIRVDTISTNDFLRFVNGNQLTLAVATNGTMYFPSNTLTTATPPGGSKLGVGGCAIWNSNGFGLWMSFSSDGSTVSSKLLGP